MKTEKINTKTIKKKHAKTTKNDKETKTNNAKKSTNPKKGKQNKRINKTTQ